MYVHTYTHMYLVCSRVLQISDMERKRRQAAEMDKRFLQQRVIQDQKVMCAHSAWMATTSLPTFPLLQFHAQQLDKMHKAKMEATSLQQFHRQQMVLPALPLLASYIHSPISIPNESWKGNRDWVTLLCVCIHMYVVY